MVIHHIGTERQFPLLTTDETAATPASVACLGADAAIIAVHTASTHGGCSLFVHHDVQHTGASFGIILGTRIGDHLNALHHRGRHGLEYLTGSRRHHHVGLAVNIHLERAGTIHRDVILAVHRHHRHLAQHVQYG